MRTRRNLHTRRFRFLPAALTALTVPVAACSSAGSAVSSGNAPSAAATETVAAATATSAVPAGHPHGGHGGPDFLVFAALHESIGLTDDQRRAIEGLLPTTPPGPHPFDVSRAAALAAGIRAGSIPATTSAPPEDDMATHRAVAAKALDALHATLSAAQRRALLDAVEARRVEHEGNDGPAHSGERGPMAHLLDGLSLTAAQQREIDSKLEAARPPPPAESDRTAMKARLETFAGETFDGAAFMTPPAGIMKPGNHPDPFLADIAIVTAVLDASQREKLAERIEAGPPALGPEAGRPPQ